MNLSDSKKKLALAGVVCGLVAMCLAIYGNPANMAFCIGCFIRDMAGSLGMHQAEAVQYARPEIIGLVLGAFLISFATKEYRSTGGSSPMIRFVLGIVIMVGSLVFLGCPLRMILRMSAGDGNAWVGLIGFILGVSTGAFALKKGFSLGRAYVTNKTSGMVLPALMVGVLLLSIFTTLLKSSESGPGSMHAPLILSLIGGLIFGALAQKSRMCFAGGIRDVILMKNFDLLTVIAGLFAVMLVYNLVSGNFVLGFNTPGVIAHSEHLWNILPRYVCGRICGSIGRRMPAASVDLGRAGIFRFRGDGSRNVFRRGALSQFRTGFQRNIAESGDERTGSRSGDDQWKNCTDHLHRRLFCDRIYE